MADIIEFPGGQERMRREMERLLDDELQVSNPELRKCVKERVSSVLARHPGIPSLSVAVTLPAGVTEDSIQPVIAALQKEYKEKVTAFAQGLVKEICVLEVHLCKAQLGLA